METETTNKSRFKFKFQRKWIEKPKRKKQKEFSETEDDIIYEKSSHANEMETSSPPKKWKRHLKIKN